MNNIIAINLSEFHDLLAVWEYNQEECHWDLMQICRLPQALALAAQPNRLIFPTKIKPDKVIQKTFGEQLPRVTRKQQSKKERALDKTVILLQACPGLNQKLLAQKLGVCIVTVKNYLTQLENEGLVYHRKVLGGKRETKLYFAETECNYS